MSATTDPAGDRCEHFASRLGFVLAAAGSAVGLGNMWRFPYQAAAVMITCGSYAPRRIDISRQAQGASRFSGRAAPGAVALLRYVIPPVLAVILWLSVRRFAAVFVAE